MTLFGQGARVPTLRAVPKDDICAFWNCYYTSLKWKYRLKFASYSPCLLPRASQPRNQVTVGSNADDTHRSACTMNDTTSHQSYGDHGEKIVTLSVIGDVHGAWSEEDAAALEYLNPDVVVLVGDIGNEDADLIQEIRDSLKERHALVVLGNHDAWYSLTARGKQRALKVALASSALKHLSRDGEDRIKKQLDILGKSHIGFSSKAVQDLGLVFVGGRPFSKGGHEWAAVREFYEKYYGIHSFEDSTNKILESVLDEQYSNLGLVVVGHNGPSGLGCRAEDPCGVDFMEPADDFGDPDLEEALEIASSCGRNASLVLFGHMHHTLKKGGYRNMVEVDEGTGTVYLNAAVVPRVKNIKTSSDSHVSGHTDAGVILSQKESVGEDAKARHFMQVTLADGIVQKASNVWVRISSSKGADIVEEQALLKRNPAADDPNTSVVSFYKAYTDTWEHKIVRENIMHS